MRDSIKINNQVRFEDSISPLPEYMLDEDYYDPFLYDTGNEEFQPAQSSIPKAKLRFPDCCRFYSKNGILQIDGQVRNKKFAFHETRKIVNRKKSRRDHFN